MPMWCYQLRANGGPWKNVEVGPVCLESPKALDVGQVFTVREFGGVLFTVVTVGPSEQSTASWHIDRMV